MKARTILWAAAAIALAACNKGGTANNTSATGGGTASVPVRPVQPPANGDWTTVTSETTGGGFMMGNPNAKVHLIEFGSLTCPHCKAFDDEGVPSLIANYVKNGQVSWEFRNYVRDPFDLAASLIARCNGAQSFFPVMRALYKDQMNWVGKVQTVPQDQLEQLQNLPPNQIAVQSGKFAGLQDWASLRGLAPAKSNQCLGNADTVNKLVEITGNVTNDYPDFKGTPGFVINGKLLDETATWAALEPKLKEALR
jgi:protein-disulfide isomerase